MKAEYRRITVEFWNVTDSVRINVRSGQIRITGKSLEINYYTTTDMKITGKVEKIEYS